MFGHLLVPLDGSRLAEASLPVARSFARAFGSRVTLLHVIEQDAPRTIHGDRHLNDAEEARVYLSEVAARAFPAGIHIETHVHEAPEDRVSRSIAEHIREFDIDLVVMCTHGRGGMKAFMFGRIAQQIVGPGETPVLFVQPDASHGTEEFSCRRLLVPLDGNPEHEDGVHAAREVARVFGAEVHMVMVVHTVGTLPGEDAATARMLPGVTAALLDLAHGEAEVYLAEQAKRLTDDGIIATAEVFRGNPVEILARAARRNADDIVVIGTHGRTGLDAFWSRSATPHLSRKIPIPFLLVPVRERNPEDA